VIERKVGKGNNFQLFSFSSERLWEFEDANAADFIVCGGVGTVKYMQTPGAGDVRFGGPEVAVSKEFLKIVFHRGKGGEELSKGVLFDSFIDIAHFSTTAEKCPDISNGLCKFYLFLTEFNSHSKFRFVIPASKKIFQIHWLLRAYTGDNLGNSYRSRV